MRFGHLALLLPIAALYANQAQAAVTGSLRGRILDDSGEPVPGARVTLSGTELAGQIATKSDQDGIFNFVSVPVGDHDLRVVKEGFVPTRYSVGVSLDRSTFVPVKLSTKGSASEEIVVEEKLPVVDTTTSSFRTQLSEDLLQNLPTGRSYQSIVNMLPGVTGRIDSSQGGPSDGNPSVRGEGQYGNNYMVDGISTRDPTTKTFGIDVNYDAIQDIQVFTDGAPAEYGQFLGMLVNVVTKDGGDEHHGSAGYWINFDASPGTYAIADLELHQEVQLPKRSFLNHEVSATAGGPVVKERLWYFTALQGTLSNEVYEGTNPEYPRQGNSLHGLAKFTWFATPDITFQYTFSGGRTHFDNYETSAQILPESQSQYSSSDMSNLVKLGWTPNARTEVEFKAGTTRSGIDVSPMSGDTELSSILNLDSGQFTQNYDRQDLNSRGRLGVGLNATRMVPQLLGSHKFKGGTEFWSISDTRDLRITGPDQGYQYLAAPSAGLPCTAAADYTDCYGYYSYTYGQELSHGSNLLSGFIQDDWTPLSRLTLNLGVRVDHQSIAQNDGETIVSNWMPAPRLGVAWDVTGNSRTLVSLNAGRYYDVEGSDFAMWADSRTSEGFTYYEYDPTEGDYVEQWTQDVLNTKYAEGLRAAHMDKITLGMEREIIPLLAIGVRGILSHTSDMPEDLNENYNDWLITNSEFKYRDYRALEFTVERKYDEVWQLLCSYTLSEAMGHTPGQFETSSGGGSGSDGNGVGVYLDDINDKQTRTDFFEGGNGWILDMMSGLGHQNDEAGWYGYLPYHSLNMVKINGSYTAPWGTTFGAVYEFDSGHAWQKRSWVAMYGDYYGFAEGRGTRFMPPVHYIDLRVSHRFDLKKQRSLELSADAFNVPDLDTAVSYYENDDANFGLTLYRQTPRAMRMGLKYTY